MDTEVNAVFELGLMGLAVGRVSHSVTKDTIFYPLRRAVFKHSAPRHAVDLEGTPINPPFVDDAGSIQHEVEPGWFGQLIECPYCASFWIGLTAYLVSTLTDHIIYTHIITILALWGAGTWFANHLD